MRRLCILLAYCMQIGRFGINHEKEEQEEEEEEEQQQQLLNS